MISYDRSLRPVFLLSKKIVTNIHHSKNTMETRITKKNIFNKNGRCMYVKTQKVCKQGQEVNVDLPFLLKMFFFILHNVPSQK